jgi:D-glycero-alpha-D-manno-heptose-7-phosphate kinase
MIITRSPLRVSLGGGGTDLPSYYREHGGFLVAAAIDKYVYIALHQAFAKELIIKYSSMERVATVDEVRHPIVREALKMAGLPDPYLEIASMADIPAGTGLGSSGSFTCALLKALHAYKNNSVHPGELAEQACRIEIELLKEPVGKQDQYASAYGGINSFTFRKDDTVEAKPLRISNETLYALEDNLLLFFTGYSRSASALLREQDEKSRQGDTSMLDNLRTVKDIGHRSCRALESGDLARFAELMNAQWEHKKQRSGAASNERIDRWRSVALKSGALGGKLIGAGGGGFLMFYADDSAALRHAMAREGLREVRFKFDFEGSRVVAQS